MPEPETEGLRFSAAGGALPVGFADELVADIPLPTSLAFTPDDRMLVTTQAGILYVIASGSEPHLALDYSDRVCTERERGMTGVTIDPAFSSNQFIYIYYTFDKYGGCEIQTPRVPVNRVARFTLDPSDSIDSASEHVIIDNIPSFGGTHNAGDLKFDRAGFLYVSVGDGGRDYRQRSDSSDENQAARDLNALLGKILRITTDGDVPDTNPFLGDNSVSCALTGITVAKNVCREIFATGLRNPFRIAFQSSAEEERLFINDTGQYSWEEVNVGISGADYGWNEREGPCPRGSTSECPPPPADMRDPLVAYPHETCGAITGGAFVPEKVWPDTYRDAYLFSDFLCGQIFLIDLDANNTDVITDPDIFATALGTASVTTLLFGPWRDTQALYYTTFKNGGEIHRIVFTGTTLP